MENAAELSDAELALLLAMDRAARILRSDGSAAPRGAPGMALPKPTSNQGPSSSDDSREPNAEPNAEALAASHAPGHNASRGALRPQRRRYLENCTAPPGLPRVVHCIPRVPSHHASAVDDFVPFSPRGVEHGSRTPVATIPCYASASGRVAYVKAAKAASTLLLALLRREFPDLGQLSNCERLEGYTFFTSAREPLERVRSAYGEVDARIAIRHRPPNVSYYLMPHAHEPARFLTFLDEVFHQRFSSKDYQVTGGMPQHAEPPVLLRTPIVLWTPVTVRVLRSERLLLDWAALLALVKPGSSPPEALPDYHVGEAKRTQMGLNRVVERDKRFNMSLKATCRVCSLYRREYACFGYAFPPECGAYEAEPVWPLGYLVVGVADRTVEGVANYTPRAASGSANRTQTVRRQDGRITEGDALLKKLRALDGKKKKPPVA